MKSNSRVGRAGCFCLTFQQVETASAGQHPHNPLSFPYSGGGVSGRNSLFHRLDSVMRRMTEIQQAVQYGYRL
ncbi:MAG: hypothetical protein PHU14_08945 [Methylovulum sp.]|nr:hypothetical protein [Methylovulum sp.]